MRFTIGGGSTPIHAAARGNQSAVTELLVGAGGSASVRGGWDDSTALHVAAGNDDVEASHSLLEHGADVNARSGEIHNNPPARWANVAGTANVVDFPMDQGAELLDWFAADAWTAMDGEFRQHKIVPQGNDERVLHRLRAS